MITVEHLTKRFGRMKAVDDVSFSIKKGEIVGLLGPNGAGKTTTMRILTGFLSSDKGTVTVGGTDIEKDPVGVQKKIGYLPENNPLYRDMQVAEFLDLAARLHGIAPDDRHEALDFAVRAVDIGKVYHRPIGELSKGYRQRVGIAAALIHRPEVVILDEPTEGLDPNQRTEIRRLIKELAKERTIIMSTHVMQEAAAVCDRLIIIAKGKVIADGTAAELSRLSKRERALTVEIEGEGVEEKVRKLLSGTRMEVAGRAGGRVTLSVASGDREVRPDLSRLVWENRWTVWRLEEEDYGLEEIFRTLTKE